MLETQVISSVSKFPRCHSVPPFHIPHFFSNYKICSIASFIFFLFYPLECTLGRAAGSLLLVSWSFFHMTHFFVLSWAFGKNPSSQFWLTDSSATSILLFSHSIKVHFNKQIFSFPISQLIFLSVPHILTSTLGPVIMLILTSCLVWLFAELSTCLTWCRFHSSTWWDLAGYSSLYLGVSQV